jgi:precorrin-6B C5,15-methyltransferase / cobalt-precorrin-6B C5,C15-methyltransferase
LAHQEKISIIGIGDDGLDALSGTARAAITGADLLIGDERMLRLVGETGAERIVAGTDLNAVTERIAAAERKRIAVLVYGDPLFYGWARYLCDKLGKDRFEVVPHVSSMQLAFARVRESWDEAYLTNLANHKLEDVVERIRTAEKVGLFTSEEYGPAEVARALLDRRIDYFTAYVCENLGSPDERVTKGSLREIAGQRFAALNVVILVREQAAPDRARDAARQRLFGNPDEAFLQSKPKEGLLTPAEVRSMALAELDIRPTSIVWDVGAGSGSVGIEAAQIATAGNVYSIEMDADELVLIGQNAERLGVMNVMPVHGRAPEAWKDLPNPDCVFVEGAGGEACRIVEEAFGRLAPGGRLVANLGSIENLAELHRSLSRRSPHVRVWMINIARGNFQFERVRFDALNPTFLLAVVK